MVKSKYFLTVKEFKLYPTKEQKKIIDKEIDFFLHYRKLLFKKAGEYERKTGARLNMKGAEEFAFKLKQQILALNFDYSKYYFNDHFSFASEILVKNRLNRNKKQVSNKRSCYSSTEKRVIRIDNLHFDETHLLFKENCSIRIRPNFNLDDRFHFFNIIHENDEYKLIGVSFKRPQIIPKSKKACGIGFGFKNFMTIYDTAGEVQQINLEDKTIDRCLKQAFHLKKILTHNLEKNGNNPLTNNCIKLEKRIFDLNARVDRIRTNQYNRLAKVLVFNYDYISLAGVSNLVIGDNEVTRYQKFKYSFGSFRKIIENQARKYGKVVYVCDRYFPYNQICSNCGLIHKEMDDLTSYHDRIACKCGLEMDRDVNAAKNLLSKMITDLDISYYFGKVKKVARVKEINEGNLLFDINKI